MPLPKRERGRLSLVHWQSGYWTIDLAMGSADRRSFSDTSRGGGGGRGLDREVNRGQKGAREPIYFGYNHQRGALDHPIVSDGHLCAGSIEIVVPHRHLFTSWLLLVHVVLPRAGARWGTTVTPSSSAWYIARFAHLTLFGVKSKQLHHR